jgi:hypothetical protein
MTTGPIGVNLGTLVLNSPELPFLNIMKQAAGWWTRSAISQGTGEEAALYGQALDANGYATTLDGSSLSPPQTFDRIFCQNLLNLTGPYNASQQPYHPGTYVFLFDGVGTSSTFIFDGDATPDYTNVASGRILLSIPAPTDSGVGLTLRQSGFGTGANYPKNMRLVYSPDSTAGIGGGTVVGVNGVGTNEALLNSGKMFNPDLIARLKTTLKVNTLRFMDWLGPLGTQHVNWTDRTPLNWAFWNDSKNGPDFHSNNGVPYEVCFALCNEIGANAHVCMPILTTDDYVEQAAILGLASLNSPLKVYLEYGNEIMFNGGHIDAIGLTFFPGTNGGALSAGRLFSCIRLIHNGITWKRVWGADAARVVTLFCGWNAFTDYNRYLLDVLPNGNTLENDDPGAGGASASFTGTITGTALVLSGLSGTVTAQQEVKGIGVLPGTFIQSGSGTNWIVNRSQSVGPISMTSAYFTGAVKDNVDAAEVAPYFGYSVPISWSANTAGMDKLFNEINAGGEIPTGAGVNNLAGTSKIATLVSDAAWGNGSVPSTPANQTMIQGRVTKNLVSNINLTSGSPDVTWTAHGLVADTQVRLVTAADQSGSWAGTGITADATKGTGTDVSQVYFVLAAGLTTNTFRIATTPGGSAVTPSGTMPTAPLAYVDNLRLAVDGGTDYPLLNNSGTPWSGFDFTPGTYFWASFTNATESGAVTPGWRAVRDQAQAGGMVAQTLGWAATCFGIASARGLPLNAYEGGQTLLSGGDQGNAFDLTDFLARANRDARMGAATTALL